MYQCVSWSYIMHKVDYYEFWCCSYLIQKYIFHAYIIISKLGLQETLIHSSNNLAVKSIRDGNNNINFIKSCLAFNEVTIPSIHTHRRQLNLYLETAEVSILCSILLSYTDRYWLISFSFSCIRLHYWVALFLIRMC